MCAEFAAVAVDLTRERERECVRDRECVFVRVYVRVCVNAMSFARCV